ncbi:MAG: hypothetical protein IJ131_03595 [Eggerthellaceae bacterium]|nr:hypothetical protein [Eggerthellaceae bacterium]
MTEDQDFTRDLPQEGEQPHDSAQPRQDEQAQEPALPCQDEQPQESALPQQGDLLQGSEQAQSRFSGKAAADLEHTQKAVGKVAYAASEVRDLLDGMLFLDASGEESEEEVGYAIVDMKAAGDSGAAIGGAEIDAFGAAQAAQALQASQAQYASPQVQQQPSQPPLQSPQAQPTQPLPAQPPLNDQPTQELPLTSLPQAQAPQGQPEAGQQPLGQMQPNQTLLPQEQQVSDQGYWRGFVPYDQQAAAFGQQAAPYGQGAQPLAQQAGQPTGQQAPRAYQGPADYGQGALPMQQPLQPTQQMPQPYSQQPLFQQDPYGQQPAPYGQGAQPLQDTRSAYGAQPGEAPYQQPANQPYQQPGAAPYQQPGEAPYQQPASQAYTPQLQQPAPYVPASDLTVPQQPNTPAYAKTKSPVLPIVLAVVVGLVCIGAAIGIGRFISDNASDSNSEFYDQLTGAGSSSSGGDSESSYYQDHDWGQGSGRDSSGNGGGASPDGPGSSNGLEDSWSPDELFDLFYGDGSGASHVEGGDVDADDGELHHAWDKNVSYSYTEESYNESGLEKIDFYGKNVSYDFDVRYPQLSGDIPNLDALNAAIKAKAMETVEKSYLNPTNDAKKLVESFAPEVELSDNRSGSSSSGAAVGALLASSVDYAIMYNNEDFISIAFSDEYALGSRLGGFISLRTVNANLKTGELYEIGDVISVNQEIASAFADNLTRYDNGSALRIAGRENLVKSLMGEGKLAGDVATTFFVDGNGKVNLGATYGFGSDSMTARGWWDYTLTDAQLDAVKKDSSMWDLIAASAPQPESDQALAPDAPAGEAQNGEAQNGEPQNGEAAGPPPEGGEQA